MKNTWLYPRVQVDTAPVPAVAQAGGLTLTETITATGLGTALSRQLDRWRRPLAVHDPAKVLLDLAITLALGGEHLSDIAVLRSEPALYGRVASDPTVSRAVLRSEPALYGRVASDPTVSRVIDALAADAPAALKAINAARAAARSQAWKLAGRHAPDHGKTAKDPLVIDLDATLITSHSEKETRREPGRRATGSTRCARSSTTARMEPGNP